MGIYICLNCSGIHRSFGVQISFIRSVTMDRLQASQLEVMKEGGNENLYQFFETFDLNYEPI